MTFMAFIFSKSIELLLHHVAFFCCFSLETQKGFFQAKQYLQTHYLYNMYHEFHMTLIM